MNETESQQEKSKPNERRMNDYVVTHTEVDTYHVRSPSGFAVTVRYGYFPNADFPSGRFKTWNCSCRQSVAGHSCRHFKMVADWIEANGRTQI